MRPPEYLEDVRERELEIAAAEARLASIEQLACPYCGFEIEKSFLRCPSCLRRLKEPCTVCGKPLDPRWKICPYCEAEVGRRSRRRGPGRAAAQARAGRTRRNAARGGGAQRSRGRPTRQRPTGAPSRRSARRSAAPAPARHPTREETINGQDPDPGEAGRVRAPA